MNNAVYDNDMRERVNIVITGGIRGEYEAWTPSLAYTDVFTASPRMPS